MVWQVLRMVAKGKDWDTISAEWDGKVSKEAIAEAISLAEQLFVEHSSEYLLEKAST